MWLTFGFLHKMEKKNPNLKRKKNTDSLELFLNVQLLEREKTCNHSTGPQPPMKILVSICNLSHTLKECPTQLHKPKNIRDTTSRREHSQCSQRVSKRLEEKRFLQQEQDGIVLKASMRNSNTDNFPAHSLQQLLPTYTNCQVMHI